MRRMTPGGVGCQEFGVSSGVRCGRNASVLTIARRSESISSISPWCKVMPKVGEEEEEEEEEERILLALAMSRTKACTATPPFS